MAVLLQNKTFWCQGYKRNQRILEIHVRCWAIGQEVLKLQQKNTLWNSHSHHLLCQCTDTTFHEHQVYLGHRHCINCLPCPKQYSSTPNNMFVFDGVYCYKWSIGQIDVWLISIRKWLKGQRRGDRREDCNICNIQIGRVRRKFINGMINSRNS